MAEKLIKAVVDCSTNTTTLVELTEEEIEQLEAEKNQAEIERAEREAETQRIADLKASAKANLISGKPLTEDEAKVITG